MRASFQSRLAIQSVVLAMLCGALPAPAAIFGDKSSLRHTVRDLSGANDSIDYTAEFEGRGATANGNDTVFFWSRHSALF